MKKNILLPVLFCIFAWGLFFFSGPALAVTKDYHLDSELTAAVKTIGNKNALVIGINYSGSKKLPYAQADAQRIADVLETVYGFSVTLLTGNKNMTKDKIETALWELVNRTKEGDQVVVYFSGHGTPLKRNGRITGGFLVPSNARPGKNASLVSMGLLEDISESMVARHALFIIDACFSGIAGRTGQMKLDPSQTLARARSKMRKPGRHILTAGESDETAEMFDELKMSVYSHYLEKALRGEGDANGDKDGVLTLSELYNYVDKQVNLKTRDRQHPLKKRYLDMGEGELVFIPKGFIEQVQKDSGDPIDGRPLESVPEDPGRSTSKPIDNKKETPKGKGKLIITMAKNSKGAMAHIKAPDGRIHQVPTPVKLQKLAPGSYQVVLKKPLFYDKSLTINVGVGYPERYPYRQSDRSLQGHSERQCL